MFGLGCATVAAMLAERPYMRGEYHREKTSALTWLLSAIIAGFVLQISFSYWSGSAGERLEEIAALSVKGLGQSWGGVLLSHTFFHSTRFILHAVGNSLLLWFLGRELMPLLGARRFVGFFFGANLLGAFAWLAVHWQSPGDLHMGATAAICGLLVLFAGFNPDRRMSFLLFFLWPVSFKPKHVVLALAAFDLLGLFLHELPRTALPFDLTISHSAHLGGMLAGLIYFKFLHNARWFNPQDRGDVALPRWLPGSAAEPDLAAPGFDFAPPATSPEDLRAEIDLILDKINSHGLAALTPAERRLLDEARHNFPRR